MYPTPDVNSTTELLQYVNFSLVNGMLGIGLLILFWVILFVRLSASRPHFAFASTSFFTGLASLILWGVGLVSDYVLLFCIFMSVISAIWLVSNET